MIQKVLFIALLMSVLCLGCITSGTMLSEERISTIVPGKSTKGALLDMLGVPAAIAARDETITLSSYAIIGKPLSEQYTYQLRAETFFALLPPVDEYSRIYYYYYAASLTYPVWYILYFGENGMTRADRLWLLINEKTGIVEDYAFKQYEQDTIFGRSP